MTGTDNATDELSTALTKKLKIKDELPYLPEEIFSMILDYRSDIMDKEYKKKLIGAHRWRFDAVYGVDAERDKRYRDSKYLNINYSFDPYFLRLYLPKGEDIEECSVFYMEDETLKFVDGTKKEVKSVRHDLSVLTGKQLKEFYTMSDFYDKCVEFFNVDDDIKYTDYMYERVEGYNPYLAARDEENEYGDYSTRLTLGDNNSVLYDALTEAAKEWAIEYFDEDELNTLYEPTLDYLENFLWDEFDFKIDLSFSVEDFLIETYGDDYGETLNEFDAEKFSCCVWEYLIKKGFDDPYSIIKKMKEQLKSILI